MKKIVSEEKCVICRNEDSLFRYFGWPSVARLQDGTLAMVCSGFRLKHICPFGKTVICYSRDEGRTWTRPAPVIDTTLDDRDGGIVPFGDNRVIVTSFNNTIAQQRAWNGIASGEHQWKDGARKALSEAYLAVAEEDGRQEKYLGSTYCISGDGGYTFGPIKKSPVTSPHGPCVLKDGTLLWVGRRFSSNDAFDDGGEAYIKVCRLNEKDDFEETAEIENIKGAGGETLLSCEPHATELPDGKIIVHIRVQHGPLRIFTVYQAESTDGGKTFTSPRQLLGDRGGSPAHLLLHSGGGLVSVYGYREAPYGIRAMFSRDGGETWDTDYVLDDEGRSGDLGYPASVELKDGRILTVFYENIGDESVIMQRVWEMPKGI